MSEKNDSIWDEIYEGKREPINILYTLNEVPADDIESIEQWGQLTGLFTISYVKTVKQAVAYLNENLIDVIILCNLWIDEAKEVSRAFPHLPICMAQQGGYERFDFSKFPSQVINAQWIAPREGEFMETIEQALSKTAVEIIYRATSPKIEITKSISDDLLRRLRAYPHERFQLDPRVFEETVAEILCKMGYDARLTPRSGDKGRDVIASIKTPVAPLLLLVECKRYSPGRLVGPEPITRLWFRTFDDHANMAMVVTTSSYQPVAVETAKSRGYQISLKDGEDYINWIRSLHI